MKKRLSSSPLHTQSWGEEALPYVLRHVWREEEEAGGERKREREIVG